MPIRCIITKGTTHDSKKAIDLIEGFEAEVLLADRGCDSNAVIDFALSKGIKVVIPPGKYRKTQLTYDNYLYKIGHLLENAFLKLKHCRGRLLTVLKLHLPFTEQ